MGSETVEKNLFPVDSRGSGSIASIEAAGAAQRMWGEPPRLSLE